MVEKNGTGNFVINATFTLSAAKEGDASATAIAKPPSSLMFQFHCILPWC